MSMRLDALTFTEVLAPLARTATANGTAIDMHDYTGKYGFILTTTAGTGTTPTLDLTIEDSADGSTGWATVTNGTFAQVTDAADYSGVLWVEVDAQKKYLRATATIAGTTPSFTLAVLGIGQKQAL